MRLVIAVAGILIAAGPASAQYMQRPMAPIGPSSAQDVYDIVQAMGLDPVGPTIARGPFVVQRARDDFGRVLRVTVDMRRSQVISVEPAGAPRGPYASYEPQPPYGPYASYGPRPVYGPEAGYRPYRQLRPGPGYAALGPDGNAEFAPPGSVMAPNAHPLQAPMPHAAVPQKPKAKSAAVTPQHPPALRKRPTEAPQQAAGSVEPVPSPSASPQAAPAPPPAPAAKPQDGTMTPVAPLE